MAETTEIIQPASKWRWFHFHLSTAIVMMLVASILVWLNIGLASFGFYGWPIHMFSYDFTYFGGYVGGYHVTPTSQDFSRLAVNVACCVFVIFAVAVTCERRLSRDSTASSQGTLIPLVIVGGVGLLYNVGDPIHHYYRSEDMTAPVMMRVLSLVAILFLTRFCCAEVGRRLAKPGPSDEHVR